MKHLRTLLQRQTGLALSDSELERAVRERAPARGADGQPAYAPQPDTPEFEALLDLLVVPESWMLRDPAVFAHALRFVQRRLLEKPGVQLRILSLPCAGGEEPYSMAMTLLGAGIVPAQCRIDAIDLSRAAIERARQGRFTGNAFRNADSSCQARWFTRDGEHYLVAPPLRDYICFSQGNLFALPEHVAKRRYDLVFCRNLLIYFSPDACARAAARLADLLAADGQLLSGYAEAPTLCAHGFAPHSLRTPFALAKAMPRGASPDTPPTASGPPARASAHPPGDRTTDTDTDTAMLLARARSDADRGRLAEAGAACEALLRAVPDCAEAYYLLGLVSESAGDDVAAQASWQRCLYLDPGHYEVLCGLALLHEQRGDVQLAARLRRRAGRVFARRSGIHGAGA